MISINDLIGVPFKNGGRDLAGMDCYGLVWEIYRRLGVELPKLYIDCFDIQKVNDEYQLQSKHLIKLAEPEIYCIMAIISDSKKVDHFGIYLGNHKFIHATRGAGVCRESIDHPYWKHRIEGYYRWEG